MNSKELKKELIEFLKWLNELEELKYTEKGIEFYVELYLKQNGTK